ncbi:MsnO8 family LLM class oxidoreductase [Kineosporia mesophila]|uniref:MsnO8 family LLM class oxidoreductase n=1 Tax=Kineosporia mesophila TaxID=566012 RepID=A0ABP6ZET9_9ACTN|nr:MsnO8 family LLM class oxidoreductase [Kineosporia mesophila]MCD5351985.1 MsnO8 family LLM class oxidoreductase [Kineosporia mesophila]
MLRLSLLDRSRTRAGHLEGDALVHSIQRAQRAERYGYERFWAAEHHAVPGIASGAPAVLLAAVGARTSTIRIGSGGVMLPNHQPLVVAEQWLMLAALFPGRVDLGLGRSLGFTAPVRRALRQEAGTDTFAADITETLAYLRGTADVTAHPAAPEPIAVFVLATGAGIGIAASLGLPVVIGGPILANPELPELLTTYRTQFRGDAGASVIISAEVLIADTPEQARELALPEAWAMARSRQTGVFPALEPVSAIRSRPMTGRLAERVDAHLAGMIWGTRQSVAAHLEGLAERTGAHELLASGATFDRDALDASDAELASLLVSAPAD